MGVSVEYQGWDIWEAKFKPKDNHLNGQGKMYETYGEEYEYVKSISPNFVWTYVDGDMSSILIPGVAYVNRIGYYICEVPWENELDSCLLSVEEECECYDEDGYDDNDGEYGRAGCEHCEGYGYVTNYV